MTPENDSHYYADRTILGERLKWWRTKRKRTIENVASCLGVSTATWGHWETGHTFPRGEMLLDISRLTGLPLQILFCPNLEACPLNYDEPGARPDRTCCQCGRIPIGNPEPGTIVQDPSAQPSGTDTA